MSELHSPVPLMSTDDLADYLRVPARTLDQWASQGKGPAFLKIGRYRRYRPEDVETWLDGQVRASSRRGSASVAE